jgi:iron complex outermembrane receptor protein
MLTGLLLASLLPAAVAGQERQTRRDSVYLLPGLDIVAPVTGQGTTRGANVLDSLVLTRVVPAGTSALRTIERLPGVNVQSADPFGVYEWSTRITIRGFQSQQIGQTLDGVPLGDMSYGNFNGLNIARAIDANNLANTTVQQGSGALSTASANNLGGVVAYRSADAAELAGLRVQQLVGANSALRTHVRADLGFRSLGEGANNGIRAFVSYARTDNDKWKGGGQRLSDFPGNSPLLFGQDGLFRESENWQDQLNAKVDLSLGSARLTGFYNYSDKKESDYMDLSLGVFRSDQFGPRTDYWQNWDEAKTYADFALEGNPLGDVAYYMSAQGARQDHLGYVRADFLLGQAARFIVTPYFHTNRGGGDWHAPSYGASYSPDPIMFRQSQYRIDRYGATGRIVTEFASQQLEGGLWFESNEVNLRRPRWRLVNYEAGPEVDFRNVLRLDFDRTGEVTTALFYLQNTSRLLENRLGLTYGIKYLHVDADFRSNGNTPTDGVVAPLAPDASRPSLSLETEGSFLPQIGAVYAITQTEEIFGNWSENMNQYPYSPQSGAYNVDPSLFSFLADSTDAERASTFDVGVRTRRGGIEASLAAYYVSYRNRLISVSSCPPTVTCATGLGNVGDVTSRGMEALLRFEPLPGLGWFNSGSYNVSTFDEDYLANRQDPASRVTTGGKDVYDSPRLILTSSLGLTRGGLNASVTGRHVSRRAFTFTNGLQNPTSPAPADANNDEGFVPSYTLFDLGLGYRIERVGTLKGVSLQFNIKNLFDETYIASIGTNGISAVADNQTLQTGPSRLAYITIGLGF